MWFNEELRVQSLKNQVNIEVDGWVADAMAQSGEYQKSFGLFPGTHYRKGFGESCFHLRIHEGRAFLHWDRWDPRRHALLHFFETPELWGTSVAAVLGIMLIGGE